MGRKRYSAETKARAAADLLAGETVRATAKKHGMSQTAVADLSRTSKRGAVYVRKLVNINDVQELFLEHLAHGFAAMRNMTDLTHDRAWLRSQDADQIATLYGVIFDKTGKIVGTALAGSQLDRALVPPALQLEDDPGDTEDAA